MATVFINEFHYDNAGGDTGEFIEIAGPAGTNLTGWRLYLYNGSGGALYAPTAGVALSGIIPDQQNGYGTLSFAFPVDGLQNGSPDGFALVDPSNTVVQFLSYEGSFTAVGGPANGMVSTDIGVSEAGTTPIGQSLRLVGTGTDSADFSWSAPAGSSAGAVNAGQSFGGIVVDQPGTLSIADASVTEGNAGATTITFAVDRTGGSDGAVSATWTATLPGGPGGADAADLVPAQALTGTVSFADGATSAVVTLNIAGDTAFEPSETFTVTLTAPTGGAALGDAIATGTIANDDAAAPAPAANVWINELHYDNASTDANEAIEIAGKAGTDLSGYQLVLYNGGSTSADAANAVAYNTRILSGVIDDEGQGYGALFFSYPVNGIQNGAPDAVALIAPDGTVVEFLSYEGVVTAGNGPAAGHTSTDIGVIENGGGLATDSLQVTGAGASAGDFAWQDDAPSSFGSLNTGQMIIGDDATGLVSVVDAEAGEGDSGSTDLVFTVRRAGGLGQSASVDYAIVLDGTADAADLDAGAVLSGTVTFAPGEFSRTITLAVHGDLAGEPNETLSVTLSNPVGNVTIVDGTATGTIVNDDPLALTISEIQGAGHTSEYVGQTVITAGVVTALRSNGFFLQAAVGDGDAGTSDGVFVFTSSAPTVAVGDGVSVQGSVAEFFAGAAGLSITEIVSPTVAHLNSGNALPTAVEIGAGGVLPPTATIEDDGFTTFDPASDGIDFWESLEGMLVTLDTPQAVSNTNAFGEVDVVASLGAGATGMNDRGGISISAGDFNPEKIQIDDLVGSLVSGLSIGDQLTDVTGVVNYAFDVYEVLVTEDFAVTEDATSAEEATALAGDLTHLSLATYNLENLDPLEHSADPAVGDRFDALAADIVDRLGAPDILAVQEIQDADGPGSGSDFSGALTAQYLIEAIEDAGGPTYVYVEVVPTASTGGEPGGNIRNGYFYNAERVTYVDGSARIISDPAYNGSRNPLVADFQFNGQQFSAINVHFTSRGGSDPLWGATQPPADGGAGARLGQAAAVQAYVNDALASDPSLEFAVLGDFNGFYFEDFQQQLTDPALGGVFTNLNTLLPEAERYSYLFDGNAQQLDNILVTGGLYHNAAYDAVHLNSQMLDTSDRPTDHDPQLALLYFNLAPVAQDDAVAVNEDAMTANLWDALLSNDSDPGSATPPTIGSVDASGTLGVVLFDEDSQTLQYVADDAAFDALSPGESLADSFSYTIVDADGATSTATVVVTVTGLADGVTLDAGNGADTVTGTADEDVLRGGRGDDTVRGNGADDALFGDQGNDTLDGGAGRDLLVGGQGSDTLEGGEGGDTFLFGKSSGADTVADFDVLADTIAFEGGQSFRSARVADVNRDGALDTVLTFGTGSAVLLGIDDPSALQFVSGYQPDWLLAA